MRRTVRAMPILEAFEASIPVVAARVPSIPAPAGRAADDPVAVITWEGEMR